MTRDEIMDMAREAGIRVGETWAHATLETRCVLKFAGDVAARAAAEERKACAVIGNEKAKSLVSIVGLPVAPSAAIQRDRAEQWSMYAAAIRARAEKETK